jgi:hypothetical protein
MNNSPKLYLGMIFKNINSDDITCVKKIEDPLQVAIGLKLRIEKGLDLNLIWH